MARYGMVIDQTRCFGCHTCEVACAVSNNLPKDVAYLTVHCDGGATYDTSAGQFPNNTMSFLPMQCQHCTDPYCLRACPTGATKKDPETGIVYVEGDRCMGCKSCIIACPYKGVRTELPRNVEYYLDVATGSVGAPSHAGGTVEKCTFCRNLISQGEEPACMQMCPGRARHWGDLDDPESDVAKLVASGRCTQILADEGTGPSVYYIR